MKISIIIPVYNVEKYLARCLDSVLGQTFQNWEAICINDGSPDNSIEILNNYAKKDSRFKIIDQKNGGISKARNAGIQKVTGDYILFLDSDDFIHPQTMEIAHKFAEKNKTDIVSFKMNKFYRLRLKIRHALKQNTENIEPFNFRKKYNLSKIKSFATNDVFSYVTERSDRRKRFQIKHCYVVQNMYKKELISDIKFEPNVIMEDAIWWPYVLLNVKSATIINTPLYYYIPQLNSIMASTKNLKMLTSLCQNMYKVFVQYTKKATPKQFNVWETEFMWPYLKHAFSKVKKLDNVHDTNTAKQEFIALNEYGMLENPRLKKHRKLQKHIFNFIKE